MRSAVRLAVAGLLAVAVPLPVLAAPPANSQVDDAARQGAALALAQTIFSQENQLAGMDKFLSDQFAPLLLKDPGVRQLENEYPGVVKEIVVAITPTFHRYVVKGLPAYHNGVAAIYVAHFSAAEMADMKRFFLTPTGQRMVRGVQENLSLDSVVNEALTNPDGPATKDAIDRDQKVAIMRTVRSIGPADYAALATVAKTSWFPKLRVVRPKLLEFETKFMNEPSPEFEAEIEKLMMKVITDRTAKGDAKTRS